MVDNITKIIWEKIKKLRKDNGLSQEVLAEHLKVSRIVIAQMENGERELKIDELQNLANLFEMSIWEFMSDWEVAPERPKNKEEDENYNFKQLLLYILDKCWNKSNVGKVVLNKLLYFCEANYYEIFWKRLTNMEYLKLPRWPVPGKLDEVIDEMNKQNSIKLYEENYFWYIQHKVQPLVKPDMSVFSENEISLMNWTIDKLSDKNGVELSVFSHWDITYNNAQPISSIIDFSLLKDRDSKYSAKDFEDKDK